MIQLQSVSLRRGTRLLLESTNLTLQPGQRMGLVGRNGTGKSSLLALIEGKLAPDAGDVSISGGTRMATVAQETPALDIPAIDYVLAGDNEWQSLNEQIAAAEASGDGHALADLHGRFGAIDGYSARARGARLLDGLSFAPDAIDRPVRSFSGGWRMRLNLARALIAPSDILLLDEPTNHLDLEAVFWLENWLNSYPGSLILISHDRDFLDQVCTHIAHIEHQRLSLYTGNYSDFETMRAERQAQDVALAARVERERARLTGFIDRFKAKATKAKQAQSRMKALERLPQVAVMQAQSAFHFEFRPAPRAPDPMLRLDHLAIGHDGKALLHDIDLTVRAGDRIGLLGANGAGKTTLMRALAGHNPALAGELFQAPGVRVGYYAQHQLDQLDPRDTSMIALERIDKQTGGRATTQELRDFLGRFGFIGDRAFEEIAPFSGGEKARLALALLVWQSPNLLLLDEPTNHLDLDMREVLTLALQSFEGALILVSHDRSLIECTCDTFWRVHDGAAQVFDGTLDDYRQTLASERRGNNGSDTPKVTSKTTPTSQPSAPRDRKAERQQAAAQRAALKGVTNRIKAIETRLATIEQEREQVDAQLADPDLYAGEHVDELTQVNNRRGDLGTEQESLEAEWLELQDQINAS